MFRELPHMLRINSTWGSILIRICLEDPLSLFVSLGGLRKANIATL